MPPILRDNRANERSASTATPPHLPQPETELEEFFDLSTDPLSIIGFDGWFKRVNTSFVRLLGYPKPELFSRSALDVIHPDDVEAARAALAQLAEGRDLVGFEARVICADGSVRWLEWNTKSMPERGLVYSVGRDTTERRRVEAELREAQRLLEASRDELMYSRRSRRRCVEWRRSLLRTSRRRSCSTR